MATKKQQQDLAAQAQAVGEALAGLGGSAMEPLRVVAPPAVYRQMVEAALDFSKAGLGKDGVNEQQEFRFRGIDSLMNLASPILAKHGLLVLPTVLNRTVEQRETRKGGILYSVALEVMFQFISALDGSIATTQFVGEAMDSGDKATNKAMSAAYKYALLQSFCIPVDAQDEADLTTPEETVPATPEGYETVKLAAFANAKLGGTEALRAYARELADGGKESPGFKAWGYLVKVDPDYAALRQLAEATDDRRKNDADKQQAVRVPGEDDVA